MLSAGENPLMFAPRVRDTWSCINVVGLFISVDSRVLAIQNDVAMIMVNRVENSQNIDVLNIGYMEKIAGSNEEKIFETIRA